MCNIVVINKGEVEIGTPQEFLNYFGELPELEDYFDTIEMNSCLCQVDTEKFFIEREIQFKKNWGDFYVGMLDEVEDDNS